VRAHSPRRVTKVLRETEAAFAARAFQRLVPLVQYLTTSRMLLAKELLVERQKSISLVVAVGYGAEAVFKRELGVPPARWGDQQVAA
jgi:YesN/AraC family two-component response regulator